MIYIEEDVQKVCLKRKVRKEDAKYAKLSNCYCYLCDLCEIPLRSLRFVFLLFRQPLWVEGEFHVMIFGPVRDEILYLNLISTHIKSLTGFIKIKLYIDENS